MTNKELKLKFKEDLGTPEEQAASKYANEPNSIDEFTLGDKMLMRAAFLAGIEWARKNKKKK